ncbi:Type IV secretion system protein virB5 [Oligella sp. MSHR50489EDL]|uniref:type IV secretion system protein n=1 Tax=Oligella sp. MSHR50489EDL TaxID=3139409 RepID=UPI003D814151
MKQKLVKTLVGIALCSSSLTAFAQGIPTFDASAVAKQVQQLAQIKEQIENQIEQIQNQVKQIEEAKNQVMAMTGSREMGNFLKDAISEAVPDDWKKLYDSTGIEFNNIADPKKLDINASLKNLSAIDKITKDSLLNSQKIMAEINKLTNEINNTKDIKAASDLQARINTQQLALQQQQMNLEQAYRAYEINEKIIQQQKKEREICILNAWGKKTDKRACY